MLKEGINRFCMTSADSVQGGIWWKCCSYCGCCTVSGDADDKRKK